MQPEEKIDEYSNDSSFQQKVKSEHLQAYNSKLCTNIEQIQKIKAQLIMHLQENHLFNNNGNEQTQLSLDLIGNSPNYECIVLKVLYGRFQIVLSILFSDDRSATHQIISRFSGNFATVYKAQILKSSSAIKCTKYTRQNFIEVFKDTIKEYVIFKVLSQLKLGPKVQRYLGFDIVIGFSCIQFCTQFCSHRLQVNKLPMISQDLKQTLQKIHSLNIIHGDIKTDNICYSNIYERYVFIDYGLHSISSQHLGYKTWTSFKGTVGYVLPQMQQCLLKEKQQFIDLYYNDLYGLEQTLKQIQRDENIDHRYNHIVGTDITKKIGVSLMKGMIIEKYLISQQAIKQEYYQKLNNFFDTQSEQNKEDIACFQSIFKDASKSLIFPNQQFNTFANIDEFGFQEKDQSFFFHYFKNQNCLIAVNKIKQILKKYTLNPNLLVQNSKISIQSQSRLLEPQYCNKLQQSECLFLFTKYIASCQRVQIDDKLCICEYMLENKTKIDCLNLEQNEILGNSLTYLIDYAIRNKLSTCRLFFIFKYNIVNAIMIQLYSETELLNIMDNMFKLKINFIRKIRIFLVFLQGLQWIKQRLQSKYNIHRILNFLFQNLKDLIDSCKDLTLNKQQSRLLQCMKLLFLPNVKPTQILQILKTIQYKLHFYYYSTNEGESALIEAMIIIAVTSQIQGEKDYMVTRQMNIFSKIKQMKHYEKMNRFLGSDIIFAKKGTSSESYVNSDLVMCFVQPTKNDIKYFSIRKGTQRYTSVIFDLIKFSIQNERRKKQKSILNFKYNQQISQARISGLSFFQELYSKWSIIEFNDNSNEQINQQAISFNYSGVKQYFLTNCNWYKVYQLLTIFYQIVKRPSPYYHRHELPYNIQAIMSIIKYYQQINAASTLIQFQVIYRQILAIIDNNPCTICKFSSYSFFNLQRYFTLPKPSLTFLEYEQYLIETILKMSKLMPYTQLFAEFLYEVCIMLDNVNDGYNESFTYYLVMLIFEVCNGLNYWQLMLAINFRSMGLFKSYLFSQLLRCLWELDKKDDYFYLIMKVYQYIDRSKNVLMKAYFISEINRFISHFVDEPLKSKMFPTSKSNHHYSQYKLQTMQYEQFCQMHIDEFLKQTGELQKKAIGIFSMIIVSDPFLSINCKKNAQYYIFCWLNYKQCEHVCSIWKIYNQFIDENQANISKRRRRFLEKKKLFVFLGIDVHKFEDEQDLKCIQLRVVKYIGKNYVVHCNYNKEHIKKVKIMQKESLKEYLQQKFSNCY